MYNEKKKIIFKFQWENETKTMTQLNVQLHILIENCWTIFNFLLEDFFSLLNRSGIIWSIFKGFTQCHVLLTTCPEYTCTERISNQIFLFKRSKCNLIQISCINMFIIRCTSVWMCVCMGMWGWNSRHPNLGVTSSNVASLITKMCVQSNCTNNWSL